MVEQTKYCRTKKHLQKLYRILSISLQLAKGELVHKTIVAVELQKQHIAKLTFFIYIFLYEQLLGKYQLQFIIYKTFVWPHRSFLLSNVLPFWLPARCDPWIYQVLARYFQAVFCCSSFHQQLILVFWFTDFALALLEGGEEYFDNSFSINVLKTLSAVSFSKENIGIRIFYSHEGYQLTVEGIGQLVYNQRINCKKPTSTLGF